MSKTIINLEDSKYRHIKNDQELDDFILDYASGIDGKLYILLDEIQNVEGWEKAINGYRVSLNCDIYITGSNSKLLSGEYATVLTGRYMEIKVYPFSFNEFLSYKLSELDDNMDDNLIQLYEKRAFDEYIMYGGIPFLTKIDNADDKLDYLDDIFNSILYKDLIQRYKIGNVDLLNRLTQYMLDNTGNLFSANSISKFLKHEKINVSHTTIQKYLNCLEYSCLFLKVPRENLVGKKLLKVNEKYYVVDTGFITAINGNSVNNPDNFGRIIENIVYLEFLRHNYKISIGKYDDYEIDFVCRKHEKKVYVQVTSSLIDENVNKREFRPLLKIKDNYPKYVISNDTMDFSRDGIIHLNLMNFLKNFI